MSRFVSLLTLSLIALLSFAPSAFAADWVVSYPFSGGDTYSTGITPTANNAGPMVPCMPTNACGVTGNSYSLAGVPRIVVAGVRSDIESIGEGFTMWAPPGSKIVDMYISVSYKFENSQRFAGFFSGSSGVNQAQQVINTNSSAAGTRTIHFSGSFDYAQAYMGFKTGSDRTLDPGVGGYANNYLAITNVIVRYRELVAPSITENSKVSSGFSKGVVCANSTGSTSGSGMGSLGLVYPNVKILAEVGSPGTGSRWIPGNPGFGPADLCFNSAEFADGSHNIAAFGRSAAGETKTNSAYTVKFDNNAPVLSELVQPTDMLRPKFSMKATDGAGAGVQSFSVTLDGRAIDASDAAVGYSVSNSASGYSFAWSTSTAKAQIAPGTHVVTLAITDKMGLVTNGSFQFVTPPLPANTVAPTVDGPAQVGRTVTCNPGTWTGAATFAYQWFVNGAASSTKVQTVVLKESDLSKAIFCAVSATGPGGVVAANSAPVQVTKFVAPVINPGTGTGTNPGTGTGTNPGTGTSGACQGRRVRSTVVKTMGRRVVRIAKVRRGKCVTLNVKVKVQGRFVPIKFKKVTVKTGQASAAKNTNKFGTVSVRFTRATGRTLKVTVLGGSTTILY